MREAGDTIAESLLGLCSTRKRAVACSIGRVTNQPTGKGGGQLDPRRARGRVLEPYAQ